jgi:hypothetical protein
MLQERIFGLVLKQHLEENKLTLKFKTRKERESQLVKLA